MSKRGGIITAAVSRPYIVSFPDWATATDWGLLALGMAKTELLAAVALIEVMEGWV